MNSPMTAFPNSYAGSGFALETFRLDVQSRAGNRARVQKTGGRSWANHGPPSSTVHLRTASRILRLGKLGRCRLRLANDASLCLAPSAFPIQQ